MNVVIIDTGCANFSSVKWAIARQGYRPHISRDAASIRSADKLLLPGVGTAQTAMTLLADLQLTTLIQSCTQPLLGICLGMQLLGSHSEENGGITTLGMVDQPVTALNAGNHPVPHMGWNRVTPQPGHPLFHGIAPGSHFYFVHSYAMPLNSCTIAECNYGCTFTAAVEKDNFFGVQFHPERSAAAGARLLKNFLEMR